MYAQQISQQLEDGTNVYVQVPLKLSMIKRNYTKQFWGLYNYLRNSSDTAMKEFQMVGIKKTLEMEFL